MLRDALWSALQIGKLYIENLNWMCAGVVRSGPGLSLLQGWSYTGDDVAEIEERLQQMASCFDDDDSADAF